jgi:hypothetical protein
VQVANEQLHEFLRGQILFVGRLLDKTVFQRNNCQLANEIVWRLGLLAQLNHQFGMLTYLQVGNGLPRLILEESLL